MSSSGRSGLTLAMRNFCARINAQLSTGPLRQTSLSHSIASRMILFVPLLVVVIQVTIFIAIDRTVSAYAQHKIQDALEGGERIFLRLLEHRSQQLITAARVLTSDPNFRKSLVSGEGDMVTAALSNHGARIGAAKMMLVAPDNKVLVDASPCGDTTVGRQFAFPDLVGEALSTGKASAIKLVDGLPYQLVVVPILEVQPVGWGCTGLARRRQSERLAECADIAGGIACDLAQR